ncbi:pyridoxal phosphate-dependent aminotransferase [Tissierella creatinini]|nr:pyridoxal phosphate-dependent aminotransferase [Tissierella creatinini]TJX66499.1 pyridoxal phosphate-dependent aminotransferase [Soehngenia saccharolytica]
MKNLSKKATSIQESVIRKMTRIASKYGAINLSQGFPEFETPKEILQRLRDISLSGPHQYSITWGAQKFREALARKQKRFMGLDINPEENIVVTCGGTEAMMAAMMTVCDPGDKVIIFSPFYENYTADTILSGAEPIYVALNPPDFIFNVDKLEEAFKQDPKAIVLCNPANPTGRVFTREELSVIANLAEKYDTYVITDEVYEHIVYEPYKHIYFASLPGMAKRTISTSSLSKTYSITGWRLGYIIGPKEVIDVAKSIHDFLTVGAAAPLQEAAVVGLNFGDQYYKEIQDLYTHKKDIFCDGLDTIGLHYRKPEGAYFIMLDISEFGVTDDKKFSQQLIEKIGVAPVPGSSFFKENINNYIRLHFAKEDETLFEVLNRLEKIRKIKFE